MAKVAVGKIENKVLGNPKRMLGQIPKDENQMVVGTIIGRMIEVHEGKMPGTEKPYTGLKGSFEAIPVDPKADSYISGKCFLSDHTQSMIETQFRQMQSEADGAPVALEFALEVILKQANNAQGYEWNYRPLQEAKGVDPLAAMRQLVGGGAPRLTDQREAPKVKEPEPRRGASRGKGKR